MKKKSIIISLILNAIIFISTCMTMTVYLFFTGEGNMDLMGMASLRYFTNLSNIYCAFVSLALLIYEIKMLKNKETKIPHVLLVLKQTGTTAVSLTFFTVLFFLVPMSKGNWAFFYLGWIFTMHCSSPLLAMVSFIFFEKEKKISWKEDFFAIIPTFLYEILYFIQVVITKNWTDFYGFTFGGKVIAMVIAIPAICLATYGISILLSFLNNKIRKTS